MAPTPRLVQDILAQGASLARVFGRHSGTGAATVLEAAALLRAGGRVVITGIGASLNAAVPFENLLSSHGIDCCSVEAGELLHYRTPACQDGVVLAVSRSGESVEITRLLAALRGRARILAVTNEPAGTLARESDLVLEVGSLTDEMVALQTYTGTLLTLHLLGMAVIGQLEAGCRQAQAVLSGFADWTQAQLDAVHEWDAFLDGGGALVHLLGRGPSYGSALEGALLLGETAKVSAVAMSVASFRHGPIEVVDGTFRGLVFAPHGRTRDLNVGLARDLVRFGGCVRVIGPVDADGEGLSWINTPPASEMLAPLAEIVPVQVAAMRMAQLRGVVPGSFRHISQVTRDERAMSPAPAAP